MSRKEKETPLPAEYLRELLPLLKQAGYETRPKTGLRALMKDARNIAFHLNRLCEDIEYLPAEMATHLLLALTDAYLRGMGIRIYGPPSGQKAQCMTWLIWLVAHELQNRPGADFWYADAKRKLDSHSRRMKSECEAKYSG